MKSQAFIPFSWFFIQRCCLACSALHFLSCSFSRSLLQKKKYHMWSHSCLTFCLRVRIHRERKGAGRGRWERRLIWPLTWPPWLTYIWSFLSRPLEALAMSCLGPEAGYIIIALTSVPLGAFLLSPKTKLLVFIASFGIGPGIKAVHRLPVHCKS